MARRSRLLAALAAGAVVALCVGVVGVAAASARPHQGRETLADPIVPTDLQWVWLDICKDGAGYSQVDHPELGVSVMTDAEGRVEIELGPMNDTGGITVDERASAIVSDCYTSRAMEPDDGIYRTGTVADRLTIYDWAVRRQQPCLASRGIETSVGPVADYLDEHRVPWYLLQNHVWSGRAGMVDDDFDMLLEARLACPPMPPFLAAQGVGW